jgi:hypothetical protein
MPVLTAIACRQHVAKGNRREIPDSKSPGLYLVIQPSGVKSFALRFRRPDGKTAKLTLGRFVDDNETDDEPEIGGPLTLAMARELAAKVQRQRIRGVDVVEVTQATRSRRQSAALLAAANSFGAAVREFVVDHKTKWHTRPRRWRDDARLLGLDYPSGSDPANTEPSMIARGLADTWKEKPLASIDGHDIHAVVDGARRHGIPGLGRRNGSVSEARGRKMHAALSVLFRWALRQRKVVVNPCAAVSVIECFETDGGVNYRSFRLI